MSDLSPRKAGRPKGSKNKHSTALMRQAVRNSGLTPLDYLMSVYQDEKQDQKVRIEAAKAACPYIHPRLSAIQVENKVWDGDPHSITNEELDAIIYEHLSKDDIH